MLIYLIDTCNECSKYEMLIVPVLRMWGYCADALRIEML